MSIDLVAWNARLADHFGVLASDRADIPLFALEHGLAAAEIAALSDKLRAHIRVSAPSRAHALVWTVYAAEIGYGFAGDEYWQTFEDKTPGWTQNGSRGWIRDAFVAFQARFSGARPSGPWAEQFSIIAWPITHAILPRDLQQQLARVLYEVRHSFSAELFEEPCRLGEFIASRSWSASARFRNLVQAPVLVGQIAAALLLQGRVGSKTLLHPMTLKRIGDDLDRERRGREWLLGARRAAEDRAKIRGLTIGRPTAPAVHRAEDARAEVVRLGIEPRLVLRPTDQSRWEVSLEIPDLSHLILRFPQVRDVLTESRCTVAGATGRPLARGRCLHGPQRVVLGRWPSPDEVLLNFERSEPQLEYLLRTECLLRPGSSWLFRVASDGLAYESRGMRVRPGSKYVLVRGEPFALSERWRQVELTCQGVHAVLLDLPSAITPQWEQALRELQLTQAKSIEVWPAGLGAVAWDGEGRGEWLASETPTLAIRSDYAIDELTIAMGDRGPSLRITPTDTPAGEPIFIELPPLPVGLHRFSVAARTGTGLKSEVIGDLDVVMRVREARPWSPGASTHGPLEVELDPASPSLEQVWEARATLAVRGPPGRHVIGRVKLFARERDVASFERELPPVTLPLSANQWRDLFEKHVKRHKQAPAAFDEAHACEVDFIAEELGAFSVRCERAFTPLRWSLRRNGSGFTVRLHDDAGSGIPVTSRYSFERPAIGEKLQPATEFTAPPAGGLYFASVGSVSAGIIVPPIVKDLAGLRCDPRIAPCAREPGSIARLLGSARVWADARLSGDVIAGAWQRTVLRAFTARVWALIGGDRWARLEEDLTRGEVGLATLRRAISSKTRHPNNGRGTVPDVIFPHEVLSRLGDADLHERGAALVELIMRLELMPRDASRRRGAAPSEQDRRAPAAAKRIRGPIWVAEFALRMASDPTSLQGWAGEGLAEGVRLLLDAPTLARAARFLVLAVDQQRSHVAHGELYAGWGWAS